MFERILVPLDGSSFGEAALGPAAALARRAGGELRLVNVHEPGWNPKRHLLGAEYRKWREEYLASVGRGLFDVKKSTAVRQGPVESQILGEALTWNADLIVMSTHGRGGISRVWLGSVADHCVRHSEVPLLLVRPRPSGEDNAAAIYSPTSVVVPLDGSELAEAALAPAIGLSETLGASIALVRVVPPSTTTLGLGSTLDPWGVTDTSEERARAARYLEDVVRKLAAQGVVAATRLVDGSNAAQSIIDEAAGDIVVMSTHSRAPAQRAVLGSVTDKVVRGSRGPVVVIPAWSAFAGGAVRGAAGGGRAEAMGPTSLPAVIW